MRVHHCCKLLSTTVGMSNIKLITRVIVHVLTKDDSITNSQALKCEHRSYIDEIEMFMNNKFHDNHNIDVTIDYCDGLVSQHAI